MEDMIYLHIGCADKYFEGFINSDVQIDWEGDPYKLDMVMDITKPWPYEDNSVDGIVSMHVFQQIYWRDLLFAAREMLRVLKRGGILRFGVPVIEKERPLDRVLGWRNINLFSRDVLEMFFLQVGFSTFIKSKYQQSMIPLFNQVDNHSGQSMFFEVIK